MEATTDESAGARKIDIVACKTSSTLGSVAIDFKLFCVVAAQFAAKHKIAISLNSRAGQRLVFSLLLPLFFFITHCNCNYNYNYNKLEPTDHK
jgi:hypothetical protein